MPSPTPTATFTPKPPTIYELLIVARGDDGLFVKNQSKEPFPLTALQLGDGKGMVSGSEWDQEMLGYEQCVVIWKDNKDPKFPDDLECAPVGTTVIRGKGEAFWKKSFQVTLSGQETGSCEAKPEECTVSISIKQ